MSTPETIEAQESRLSPETIAILLTTFNGEQYLAEQIDSLFCQSDTDWHLYIHDDGSTDATSQIVSRYMELHPDKITLLQYTPQGGACKNFMSMLKVVDAPLYMLCDQDDVWNANKIELSRRQLQSLSIPADKPAVVFTDMTIVDRQLNTLHPSFWQYSGIRPEAVTCFYDCVISMAAGCTMLFNKAARDAALLKYTPRNIPHIMMHDVWIIDCCYAAGGEVSHVPTPTLLYRQHGNNQLGAISASRITPLYRVSNFFSMFQTNIHFYRMLNAIAPFSLLQFIKAKIRYRRCHLKS